jgi:lysophospholipid acyltransferase (LPLAT)-like uncharacterized protein
MAKPRVFISSTFFDLRQIREELEEMGYDPVRHETGAIPVTGTSVTFYEIAKYLREGNHACHG